MTYLEETICLIGGATIAVFAVIWGARWIFKRGERRERYLRNLRQGDYIKINDKGNVFRAKVICTYHIPRRVLTEVGGFNFDQILMP
jgi:3-dehydroquinate synthase class II